jgi:hypothetical protein
VKINRRRGVKNGENENVAKAAAGNQAEKASRKSGISAAA